MGNILTGTCSWTDKTLIDSGWYGPDANSAESRLVKYASRFPLVEVDSTYYSMPSEKTAELWAERTPLSFTFDVKAFRLLTGHPAEPKSLPKHLREALPPEIDKPKLYLKDLPSQLVDQLWSDFRQSLMPLHSAGKLGVVLFQFPPGSSPDANPRTSWPQSATACRSTRTLSNFGTEAGPTRRTPTEHWS